jgi:hypothetical protein
MKTIMNKLNVPILALALLTLLTAGKLAAQDGQQPSPTLKINSSTYNTGIGLRGGLTSGFTVTHFFSGNEAFIGILGYRGHSWSLTAMYGRFANAYNITGLYWYYGYGAHLSMAGHHTGRFAERDYYHHHDDEFGIGIDGLVGMEYKIPQIPIAVSLELKPFLEINSGSHFWFAADPGIGIKLTF